MPEAFPLEYPQDRDRTPDHKRERAVFKVTFAKARDELLNELDLMGAVKIIISTDIPLRKDGLPYASAAEPSDPGVAVYFEDRIWLRQSCVFACDGWDRVKDNLRDIGLTIAAKRLLIQQRKTVTAKREFVAYQTLPPADSSLWWATLRVTPNATVEEIKAAYRKAAKRCHPDVGSDSPEERLRQRAEWDAIQQAYEKGLRERA